MTLALISVVVSVSFKRFSAGQSDQIVTVSTTEVIGYLDLANGYSKALKKDIVVSLNMTTSNITGLQISPSSSPNNILDMYEFSSHLTVSSNIGFSKILYSNQQPTRFVNKTGMVLPLTTTPFLKISNKNGKESKIIFSPMSNSQRIE